MTVPAETLRAVREKAELLNGGASLGEAGDALAEMAVRRALAFCQRTDVPEDMEQAVAALFLVLWESAARNAGGGGENAGGGGENAGGGGENAGGGGENAGGGGEDAGGGERAPQGVPAMSWETLVSSGAVKTVQRGDTAITFQSGGGASSALCGTGLTAGAALEGLKPWRRLGRLKREEGPGNGA